MPTYAGLTCRLRRKMIEHLLDTLIEVLDVLVRFVRKSVARRSAPHQLLRFCVEQIDHESADLVGVDRRRRIAEPTAKAPAASEPVVERIEGALRFRHLDRDDRNVTARCDLREPLLGELRVDSALDSLDPQRILRLDLLPRIRLVLGEVRGAIVISLHMLPEYGCRKQQRAGSGCHHSSVHKCSLSWFEDHVLFCRYKVQSASLDLACPTRMISSE